MIAKISSFFRKFHQWFSRSYWAVRLLRLSKIREPGAGQGLVLVQIDGFSKTQLERALEQRRMPFLASLLTKQHYQKHSLYSGMPSTTPAVQGELFYGVKGCVPAFNFVEHQSGKIFVMYEPKAAAEIERCLAQKQQEGGALLEGGSSYSNIFCGGASESHFCAAGFGWQGVFKALNPFSWIVLSVFHLDILMRIISLLTVEFFLAVYDCFHGTWKYGEKFRMELQFVLARVFVCVWLREMIVLGAKIDIARGLPVIHLNFFGYDEQSHRRGPSSDFAHWSLRGIDDGMKRIWNEIAQSEIRGYDLWIYSDHGQADTLPYHKEHGRHLEDALAEIFGDVETCAPIPRSFHPESKFYRYLLPPSALAQNVSLENNRPKLILTGMGPLVHLYPSVELTEESRERYIQALLEIAKVPIVFFPGQPGEVYARTVEGSYTLPKDAAYVFGSGHPFLNEVTADFIQVCHHPYAGKFIVSAWRYGEPPRTFPLENGSHAGFTPEETHGFALLPQDAPLGLGTQQYIRPLHLRHAALRLMDRIPDSAFFVWQPPAVVTTFRILTYNVHGCVGMDGRLSPERIARVIARHDVDAVCLQELDVERPRSGGIDQAELIARKLQMKYHFHPSCYLKEGMYGNAILCRYPMQIKCTGPLPRYRDRREFEKRGALWVEIDAGGTKINLINTHLSLWPQERLLQTKTLLGPEWAGSTVCKEPVILCGDFNASPDSLVCRKIGEKFRDAQTTLESYQPYSTWLSHYPFSRRIDHVFVSPQIHVSAIAVPQTELDKAASDHCPLIIEMKIVAAESSTASGSGPGTPDILKEKRMQIMNDHYWKGVAT